MSRPPRAAEGGLVYHALNRGNARVAIFEDDGGYEAFRHALAEAVARQAMRLLAYGIMPNHFHLALAQGRWRSVGVHALADHDAHPALARPGWGTCTRGASSRSWFRMASTW